MEAWTGQEGLWLLFVCPEVELNCLYSFANELKLLSHGLLCININVLYIMCCFMSLYMSTLDAIYRTHKA